MSNFLSLFLALVIAAITYGTPCSSAPWGRS